VGLIWQFETQQQLRESRVGSKLVHARADSAQGDNSLMPGVDVAGSLMHHREGQVPDVLLRTPAVQFRGPAPSTDIIVSAINRKQE
jgi:hypothetical protein